MEGDVFSHCNQMLMTPSILNGCFPNVNYAKPCLVVIVLLIDLYRESREPSIIVNI